MVNLSEKVYIHKNDLDNFNYIPLPVDFVKSDLFKNVSAEAKILYGLLLNRMYISEKNSLVDGNGRLYVYFTIDEVREIFKIGATKAKRLFKELISINGGEIGLITKVRFVNKASRIYVLNFKEIFLMLQVESMVRGS